MQVDKYDRQIRLWGTRGQRRLGEAKVALVRCSGEGIEALKNLVLPGVGQIDIWDATKIEVRDLSLSFFYEYEEVGQPKAEVVSSNLLEMNPDVKGHHYPHDLDTFLSEQRARDYTLVIFSALAEEEAIKASAQLWELGVPCIFVTVVGYFFHVRLQKELHFVESSNTNSKKYYMRITDPFPELLAHAMKHDIDEIACRIEKAANFKEAHEDLRVISNIPYVLLLIQVYAKLPAEQRKREDIITQLKFIREKLHERYRDNFDQALSRILDMYQTPDNFLVDMAVLEHPQVVAATPNSHLMLRFLKAVAAFYQETGKLPQPTVLPDMHTTTADYIELKGVYKQQHERDVARILGLLGDGADPETIREFINNLSNIEMVAMRPYAQELQNPDTFMLNYLQHEKDILIALRAFKGPGENYEELLARAQSLKQQFGINELDERFVKEVHRGEGRTSISICSMAGAVAGQEAIKLITECFAPANNGYLYDGAQGVGYQVKL